MAPASPLRAPLLPGNNIGAGGNPSHATAQPVPSKIVPQHILIEEIPQADGSLLVKASTTTPHPNGYHDVRTEHYAIPAAAVDASAPLGTLPPLRSEYLARVEYRVLPPGSELAREHDDASTVYAAPAPTPRHGGAGPAATPVANTYTRRRGQQHRHRMCAAALGACVFFAVLGGAAVVRDFGLRHRGDPTPGREEDASDNHAAPDDGTLPLTPDAAAVPSATKDGEDEHWDGQSATDEKNATPLSLDPGHTSNDSVLSV